jgi:hypothetical protein
MKFPSWFDQRGLAKSARLREMHGLGHESAPLASNPNKRRAAAQRD